PDARGGQGCGAQGTRPTGRTGRVSFLCILRGELMNRSLVDCPISSRAVLMAVSFIGLAVASAAWAQARNDLATSPSGGKAAAVHDCLIEPARVIELGSPTEG